MAATLTQHISIHTMSIIHMRNKVLRGNPFRKRPPNIVVVIDVNKVTYSITSICFVRTHS